MTLTAQQRQPKRRPSPVVELRRYQSQPGTRDALIQLFESDQLVPPQANGIEMIGQFRDLADEDAFVWIRRFPSIGARAQTLAGSDHTPSWRTDPDTASETMIASDEMLLLQPARQGSEFASAHTASGESPPPHRQLIECAILHLAAPADETDIVSFFDLAVAPELAAADAVVHGYFVTDCSENTFSALPPRTQEHLFVWFMSAAHRPVHSDGDTAEAMRTAAQAPAILRPPELLRLRPTPRSRLHPLSPPCPRFAAAGPCNGSRAASTASAIGALGPAHNRPAVPDHREVNGMTNRALGANDTAAAAAKNDAVRK